ncbi:MAG: hypothetical protein DRI86_12175 [Bacteroidetes bacterium]|nr:MAG: hypothetical protein DRI86_12175 [Bacteroidota bacterium]
MELNQKIFIGQDITNSSADVVKLTRIEDIYKAINEPSEDLYRKIIRLQKVKEFDKQAYTIQKRHLPYFIGAEFEGGIRRMDNFIEINWFVLDLDHVYTDVMEEERLKNLFSNDKRIVLVFASPGGDGMKLVFKLKDPIVDTSKYTSFYKAFSNEFARHYSLEKYVDFKTSDVSRICFLSVDNTAIYNPNPIEVDAVKYVSQFDLLEQMANAEVDNPVKKDNKELNKDVYKDILSKLNPKAPKRNNDVNVPEALDLIIAPIEKEIEAYSIKLTEQVNISYGKKLKFVKENDFAELNVFYGKKGFRVVISPRRGHHPQLSEIVKSMVESVVYRPAADYNFDQNVVAKTGFSNVANLN